MSENPKERAELWLDHGRPDRAESELRAALAEDPNDAGTHASLSLCLSMLDRHEEALTEAETAIQLDPDWVFPHVTQGIALLGLGKGKSAEKAARQAIAIDPELPGAYGLLANALALRQQWRPSLEAAEEGLDLDPEDEGCANARAVALIQLGEADEADFTLEAALQRDPENASTHRNMGWAALHKGKSDDAIRHYREALRLDPEDEGAREGLVEALKSRNVIYRLFLRFFLKLSMIEPKQVMALFIGTVVLRMVISSLAESVPALAPVLWPIFWCIVAFVLMTWIASPLFNTVLRFDRDGRHALTDPQIRQSNGLLATLGVGVVCVLLGFLGVEWGFLASLIAGVMVIPVTAALEPGIEKRQLIGGFTLALGAVGIAIVVLAATTPDLTERARAIQAALPEGVETDAQIEEALKDKPEIEREVRSFLADAEAAGEREDLVMTLINVFMWGFVAFTWLSSSMSTFGNER